MIASRSHLDEYHKVEYMPVTNTFVCDCKGFEHRGTCCHVEHFEPLKKTLKKLGKENRDAKRHI